MPLKSKILFAEDGISKILSIDNTISKYGDFTSTELVNIIHRENTPWDKEGKVEEKRKIKKLITKLL